MNWVSLALQLLTVIPELMKVAEKAFDGEKGSGAEKKKMVKTTVHAIVSAVTGISSGGQQETWKRIEAFIDPVIDIMCTFLFPNEKVPS